VYLILPDGLKEHELVPSGKTFIMGAYRRKGPELAKAQICLYAGIFIHRFPSFINLYTPSTKA
jgi:hypothetical protein